MKKGRRLVWRREKQWLQQHWNKEGREMEERCREQKEIENSTVTKKLLMEKRSESWSCSYWVFSLLLISPSFTFPFWWQTGHNPSTYAYQVSGHVRGCDRTFWTEQLVTLTYITPTFTFSVINMCLVPYPDACCINLVTSTCFHHFL